MGTLVTHVSVKCDISSTCAVVRTCALINSWNLAQVCRSLRSPSCDHLFESTTTFHNSLNVFLGSRKIENDSYSLSFFRDWRLPCELEIQTNDVESSKCKKKWAAFPPVSWGLGWYHLRWLQAIYCDFVDPQVFNLKVVDPQVFFKKTVDPQNFGSFQNFLWKNNFFYFFCGSTFF